MYAVFAACSLLFLSASFSWEFTLHSDPQLPLGATTEESDTDASGNVYSPWELDHGDAAGFGHGGGV